jgi:response regulator RpfG family c-di-GMP phosphodiesterase
MFLAEQQSGENYLENYLENFQNIISNIEKEKEKHTVLIVDDEINNLQLLKRTLRRKFNILTAIDGKEALEIIEKEGQNISLIISDQRMPKMTGTEFLSKVSEKYPYIIKMLLTGYSDIEAMIDGVNKCQLFQYITKPFEPDELEMIIDHGIEAYELTLSKNTLLQDLKELFFTTVKSISSALDAKDTYTHGHSHRVTLFSLILSKELNLEESFVEEIETTGLLHDIGKIGVPESILCKAGKLTDEEYGIIQQHAPKAEKILSSIPGLKNIALWASCHHERWDGRGYPNGLKYKDIPLPSRILAIADTYDAMTSNRSYRKGLPHEVAVEEIKNCSDSQFDPEVTEAFLKVEKIFKEAAENPTFYYDEYSVLNKKYKETA